MKKITFLMLCFFIVTATFAQKNKKEIIHLKNGSVLKGKLVQVDDDKVVVHSSRNIFVFKNSEIDTITSNWISKPKIAQEKDWFVKTSIGILAGSSDNSKSAPASFMASFNYNLTGGLYAGLGSGVEFYEESYMPAFVNLEYNIRDSHFTPFVGLKGGYLIPLDDKAYSGSYNYYWAASSIWPGPQVQEIEPDGGFMLSPSFGFRGMISENFGWMFSFGYRYHQLNFTGDNDYGIERNYNRLTVRIGIIFN